MLVPYHFRAGYRVPADARILGHAEFLPPLSNCQAANFTVLTCRFRLVQVKSICSSTAHRQAAFACGLDALRVLKCCVSHHPTFEWQPTCPGEIGGSSASAWTKRKPPNRCAAGLGHRDVVQTILNAPSEWLKANTSMGSRYS